MSNEQKKLAKHEQKKLGSPKASGREKSLIEGGGAAVLTRNGAVYSIYRRMLLVAILAMLGVGFNVWSAWYYLEKEPPPNYIPVDEEGRIIPLPPLDQPVFDNGRVSSFAMEAIRVVNSYDYIRWRDQLSFAQSYFSPWAWGEYSKELKATNNLATVEKERMIVVPKIRGEPEILGEGIAGDGAYTWKLSVPVQISFIGHAVGPDGRTKENIIEGNVVMFVSRAPLEITPRGLFVQVYTFEPKKL